MARRLILIGSLISLVLMPAIALGGERGLLWRVVQACIAAHDFTGAAFPCLKVDTAHGVEEGYAVLRAPFEETHIIVTPTIRTIGVEDPRLRAPDAPNYFRDAWMSRHFVTEGLSPLPGRDDIGLAVNSRPGRSQDQLHIHVDCLRPEVKRSILRQEGAVSIGGWSNLSILPRLPRFWATLVASEDLAGVDVFSLVANGLHVAPEAMPDITIVVAGVDHVGDGGPGFMVLARQRHPLRGDIAHGEILLDHGCRDFR